MFESPSANKLKELDVKVILSALKKRASPTAKMASGKDYEEKQDIVRLFQKADDEMEQHPDIVISLDQVKVIKDYDFGSGEIYLLSYVLDSKGMTEYKSLSGFTSHETEWLLKSCL